MILIKNRQKKTNINEKEVIKNIEKILKHLKRQNYDLGIWLTTNQTIKKYNKKYRNKNKATDVLSFPSGIKKDLGDIIISIEKTKIDAYELNRSFKKHLMTLIIHGICHLLGYDHKLENDFKIMKKKESELLKLIK